MSTDWDAGKVNLQLAVQIAERTVATVPDAHDAWRLANEIGADFAAARSAVAKLRGVAALRIKDQEKLSLRGLADVIGTSHVYAGEIVKEARK